MIETPLPNDPAIVQSSVQAAMGQSLFRTQPYSNPFMNQMAAAGHVIPPPPPTGFSGPPFSMLNAIGAGLPGMLRMPLAQPGSIPSVAANAPIGPDFHNLMSGSSLVTQPHSQLLNNNTNNTGKFKKCTLFCTTE